MTTQAPEVARRGDAAGGAEALTAAAGPAAGGAGGQAPRRSVARNAAVLMGSQAVTWSLALVLAIVQPRYLGPDGVGQLRVATSLWSMAEVLIGFGAPTLLTMEFARDRHRGQALLGPLLVVQAALYLVAAVGVMGFVAVADYTPTATAIIAIIGGSSLFTVVGGAARASLYGLERMDGVARADVASRTLHVAGVTALLLAGGGTRLVAAATVAAAAANAAFTLRALRRTVGTPVRLRRHGGGGVLRRCAPYLMLDATFVVYQQVDVVVISLLVSERATGWYGTANTLFGSLLFIPTIVVTSLFPVLTRLRDESEEAMLRVVRRGVTSLSLLGVPIGIGTVVLAGPVSVQLFGDGFAGTGPVLAVMGVVLVLTFPTILLGRVALAVGRQRRWTALMAAATVATIPLDLVLVPWTERAFGNGAIGGALAYVATEAFLLVAAVRTVAPRLLDVPLAVRLGKCLLAGLLMGAATWPLRDELVVVPVAVGVAAYVAAVAALRALDAEEVATLKGLIRRDRCRTDTGAIAARRERHA